MDTFVRFLCNENAATAIEYGLIVAGIAVTILGGISALSNAISKGLFDLAAAATAP